MKSRTGWILCCFLALAACDDKSSGKGSTTSASAAPKPTLPKLTDKMPSAISGERPEAKAGDDPKADFTKLDEVYKEQDDAKGKTFLFRGYGTPLKPNLSHLSECKVTTKRRNTLEATFNEGQRDVMRALPSNQFVPTGETCPRIVVKITGFHEKLRYPQGEIVEVYDVQPDPPPKSLPGGVHFISMDDLFLAGPAAVGKIADFGVYPGQKGDNWVLVATGCSPHSGWNAQLEVAETEANASFLQALQKEGSSTCARVRFKITRAPKDLAVPRWGAEIVGTGKTYPKPHPAPNP